MEWLPFAAFALVFFSLLVWGIIDAPHRIYLSERVNTVEAESREARLEREAEVHLARIEELSRPHFVLSPQAAVIGGSDEGAQVTLYIEMINQGSPSSAPPSSWRMQAVSPRGMVSQGNPITIGNDGVDLPFPDGTVRRFVRSDGLDFKASEVLERMGSRFGVLTFRFPELRKEDVENGTGTLSVADVSAFRSTSM